VGCVVDLASGENREGGVCSVGCVTCCVTVAGVRVHAYGCARSWACATLHTGHCGTGAVDCEAGVTGSDDAAGSVSGDSARCSRRFRPGSSP
jgi:hypothetical protein